MPRASTQSGKGTTARPRKRAWVRQRDIEIILMRQLAAYLVVPIFVVNTKGTVLFYNEPAEALIGRQFDEFDEMAMAEWTTVFKPRDEHDVPLPLESQPLVIALQRHVPAYRRLRITGLDGVPHSLEVVAFPLQGQGNRMLGAAALFWESKEK
jgi:PAS domain-containing protein